MQYTFKYKRGWFWKKITVVGHKYQHEMDRMDLFLPDGTLQSIAKWSNCDLVLGTDWVLSTKKHMEKETGQAVPISV